MAHCRVPVLVNPNIMIRLAATRDQVVRANRLVFKNYAELGYWSDDPEELARNHYLGLPTRHVILITEASSLIGTISVIVDSPDGIPADRFQPETVCALRRQSRRLAELSCFAISKSQPHPATLLHFLMAFILQYSFYYLAIDRFVAVCTPQHARFYQRYYGFRRGNASAFYDYVHVKAQMLTLDLFEGFESFRQKYDTVDSGGNFFEFLYRDEHPNLLFPPRHQMCRSRHLRWGVYANQLPVAPQSLTMLPLREAIVLS
jgi:hypothetical protein